jgi:hypothetical protein
LSEQKFRVDAFAGQRSSSIRGYNDGGAMRTTAEPKYHERLLGSDGRAFSLIAALLVLSSAAHQRSKTPRQHGAVASINREAHAIFASASAQLVRNASDRSL